MIISLSTSLRVLVNTEAINMAESVGNYTRHRKAPIVVASSSGYSVIYAPAASGEALAHAYQLLLAQIAKERKLPVTRLDEQGYFLKFSSTDLIVNWYPELAGFAKSSLGEWVKKADLSEVEKAILKASVVADVGGFLLTDKQLKRTSAIKFSYMIPTLDAIEGGGASLTPQLHVRYAPPQAPREQALFYVESGSAMYTLSTELVASDISRLLYSSEQDEQLVKERLERVNAAVDALIALVDGVLFGAKRSRYMPLWNVKSMVVALSKGPVEFITSPGITRNYIKETYERAVSLTKAIPEETINLYVYDGEGLEEPAVKQEAKNVAYRKVSSHTEALVEAKSKLISILSVLSMV